MAAIQGLSGSLFLTGHGLRYTGSFRHGVAMRETKQAAQAEEIVDKSFLARMLAGEYGLALTCWALYFLAAGLFAVVGSRAVDEERWLAYLVMVAAMMAYTVMLIIGVRVAYKGPQLWKVMSRTSSVFMILNILLGISTLGFIY